MIIGNSRYPVTMENGGKLRFRVGFQLFVQALFGRALAHVAPWLAPLGMRCYMSRRIFSRFYMLEHMGRHSLYDPKIIPQVAKLCDLGATNDQIADFFGVSTDTLEDWTVRHEELAEVMRIGKAPADNRVERRLYERAVGYDYVEEVVAKSPEGPVVLQVKKHQPPDIAAMKIWLLNRKRHEWSDRREIAIEGNVRVQHKTIDPALLTDEQREVLRLAIQQALLPAPEDGDFEEV